MTSQERHEARYQRRAANRLDRKIERCQEIGTIDNVFSFQNLFREGKKCCRGVRWKSSVQLFENKLLSGTASLRKEIMDGTWKPDKYVQFPLSERGKTRHIDAPRIRDRQMHKAITKCVLLPLYKPSMIYNNGASLEGKGFEFSKRVLKEDLHEHFRKYGREGSIILIDFKGYFPSASHDYIHHRHEQLIFDDTLRKLADDIIAANSKPAKGGKYVGVPLGVEPSQAEMIAYPSSLDNYIKCQLSIKGFGHYMDDYYVLVPPDKNAKEILNIIIEKATKIGLTISRSKTRIYPLTKPFKYCKAKYTLTETGKIIFNGNRDGFKRARRKIKAFYRKVQTGEMSYMDLWSSTNGILAYFKKYNDHNRVLKLRRLFYSLFGFSPEDIENFRERDNKPMRYIVTRRFKDKAICGEVNLPAGTECYVNNGDYVIQYDGKPLCFVASESAHMYFSPDDDGCGMRRGKLIRKIMNKLNRRDPDGSNKKYQARWDKIWADDLCQKFKRVEFEDYWLWNHDFYVADMDELIHIANLIGVKED